ncbi:peptidoglycan-binding domain-containing protein [Roseovarius sp. C7]|uniref:peptidoglycan-binding domain-containing protein n=1 Tax=Roseovarius sp. C7 TaxID=3398643 RepID=UPI0039F6DEFD
MRSSRISARRGAITRTKGLAKGLAIGVALGFGGVAAGSTALLAEDVAALPVAAVQSEMEDLGRRVAEAEAEQARYGEGLISTLLAARIETLKLTRAILENRLAAEQGGATVALRLPAAEPDEAKAEKILAEIIAQQKIVTEAEAEAAEAGGLIGAVAQSRVQTEKLLLANLRGNWMAAQYGLLLPITPPEGATASAPQTAAASSGAGGKAGETGKTGEAGPGPEWADPAHPEIDYTGSIFAQLHREGFTIHGWWGLSQERAEIDDSPKVFGINVSEYKEGFQTSTPKLYISCKEGETSVVYDADDYILSDYNVNTVPVTYRIDGQDAVQDRWSKLTSSKGGGLFGAQGQRMVRQLYEAKKLFVRLEEKNGKTHDATFHLAGGQAVFDAAAAACGFSTLDLSLADYRAIQTMLNSAGYDAGTPDGVWGAGSARAMRAWQEDTGLAPTGAPDRASLAAMGLN